MAVPRIFSQGRVLLARGSASSRVASSAFLSGRIAVPRRQVTARTWALQEVASNQSMNAQSAVPPSVESSPNYHESSVTLLRVPKRASKHEIEELFKKAGFEVKRIQILIDRFTFQNCRMCYVQLGNESQAQEAIRRLDKNASLGSPIVVKGLRPDFVWGLGPEAVKNVDSTTLVFHDDAGLATALAPQLEGRRIRIGSPGWTDGPVSKRMEVARRIITEHFSKFGIECIGKMQPNTDWVPNKPRFLCLIDFKTKQGAEEAIKALDGTQIEGKPIFVNRSPMAPWRAWQLNKVDKRALAQLEKRGYAPSAIQPDKFDKAAPIRKAKKEKKKAEWGAKNQAEHDAKVAARKAGRKAQETAA